MMQGRWTRRTLAWVLAATMALVFVLALAFPRAVLPGYLLAPAAVAALVCGVRFTAILVAVAGVLAVAANADSSRIDDASDESRIVALVAVGLLIVLVSWVIERWRARLEAGEAHYRLLAENASDIVTSVRLDGTLEWISPSVERILGWNPRDLIGTKPWDLIHPEDVPAAAEAMAHAQDPGQEPRPLELRMRRADGTYAWLAASGAHADGQRIVVSYRRADEQVRARSELEASERKYRLLAENSSDVVVRIDPDRTIDWVSPSLTEALGWSPDAWVGRTALDLAHPDDQSRLVAEGGALLAGDVAATQAAWVARFRTKDSRGTYHWIEMHARQYRLEDGGFGGAVASFRVVDHEVESERELERRAHVDDLTGALKRDEALRRMADVGRYVQRSGEETAIIFCDVDNFKDVNDTYGHAAGDELLRTLARRIRETVRAGDIVARMGGDEFLILLSGVHSMDEARGIAEKVRAAAVAPVPTPSGIVSATISVGVTLRRADEDVDTTVARADRAMYEAKAAGRNLVVDVPALA